MSNTITAYFKGRIGVAESVYQNDYGIVMAFDSIDLPAHFDCYFSVLNQEEAVPGVGADNRVAIPNSVLSSPGVVTIHIPLHTGSNDSEVEYVVHFNVIGRARPIDDGAPAQMTAIEQALAILQAPITNIEEIVNEALSFTGTTFAEIKDAFVTPEMFGAVGDGETDDTQAIQDAVNAADTVIFTSPNYLVIPDDNGNCINLNDGNRLILRDAEVKIQPNSLQHYAVFNVESVSNVIIEGGIVCGDRDDHESSTGEWGHGIVITDSANVTLKDIVVKDCYGDGVLIESENVTVDGCKISDCNRNGITVGNEAENVFITNCVITNITGKDPQSCIDVEPDANHTATNIVISNCVLSSSKMGLQSAGGSESNRISNLTIEGCVIENNELRNVRILYNIGTMFINNTLNGSNSRTNLNIGLSDSCIIRGNYINDVAVNAIISADSCTNIEIADNCIRQLATIQQVFAFYNSTGLKFCNNDIYIGITTKLARLYYFENVVKSIFRGNKHSACKVGAFWEITSDCDNNVFSNEYVSEEAQVDWYLHFNVDQSISTSRDNLVAFSVIPQSTGQIVQPTSGGYTPGSAVCNIVSGTLDS